MTDEEEKDPSQIVESEGSRPCGCYETKYADRTEVQPCPPHGIMEAAHLFIKAGNMLGAVGQNLFKSQQLQAMAAFQDAVKSAAEKKDA